MAHIIITPYVAMAYTVNAYAVKVYAVMAWHRKFDLNAKQSHSYDGPCQWAGPALAPLACGGGTSQIVGLYQRRRYAALH